MPSSLLPLANKAASAQLSVPATRDAHPGIISRAAAAPGKGNNIRSRPQVEFADGALWPAPWRTSKPVEVAA